MFESRLLQWGQKVNEVPYELYLGLDTPWTSYVHGYIDKQYFYDILGFLSAFLVYMENDSQNSCIHLKHSIATLEMLSIPLWTLNGKCLIPEMPFFIHF